MNSELVRPWDPFGISVTKAPIAEKTLEVEIDDKRRASFTVRAFVSSPKRRIHGCRLSQRGAALE